MPQIDGDNKLLDRETHRAQFTTLGHFVALPQSDVIGAIACRGVALVSLAPDSLF